MCKLIIVSTMRWRHELIDSPMPLELSHTEFPSWSDEDLEKYGQAWAKFWKSDIVMLEE